ncbi:helix-turn-helix domain-containing protein [Paenibacillus sp. GCM10027626]|uniref:AraC family transcriptional regulator n=1 Tax=Paenibacillus sp. GCM10027626 TaxID=3273411 RepID=UPI00362F39F3
MGKPFAYTLMADKQDAIDRLDIRFRWGGYGIRVIRCHLTSFPPGKIIRFHKHSEYEFHFIPRGKGIIRFEETSYNVQEGQFYLTGPGVLHQQEADDSEAMDELCLHVDITPLPAAAPSGDWGESWELQEAEACIQAINALPRRPVADQYNAMAWFLTAYRAWLNGHSGAYSTIKQAVIQILLRASRMSALPALSIEPPTRNINEHRFQMATQFIHDNYASPLSLQEVAERIRISGRQLQRIFQEQSSGSFSAYLENYRLSQICNAILEGQGSIEQIALEHGFASGSYLYHVFKKRFGMTPKQFKASHAAGASGETPLQQAKEIDSHD